MHTCEEGTNSGPKIKCTQLLGLKNIFTTRKVTKNGN